MYYRDNLHLSTMNYATTCYHSIVLRICKTNEINYINKKNHRTSLM